MSRYPSHLSPDITPTKSGKAQKSRARREPSGVFSLFQPQQIQQFKEAFSLIDQDRDGLVGERDLRDTFASLGAHDKSGALELTPLTLIRPPNRLSFTLRFCVIPFHMSRHRSISRNDGRAPYVAPGGARLTVVFSCCRRSRYQLCHVLDHDERTPVRI